MNHNAMSSCFRGSIEGLPLARWVAAIRPGPMTLITASNVSGNILQNNQFHKQQSSSLSRFSRFTFRTLV